MRPPRKLAEMDEPPAKKSRIHFGSLEEQEKRNIQKGKGGESNDVGVSAAVLAGINAGNINIDTGRCVLFRVSLKPITYVRIKFQLAIISEKIGDGTNHISAFDVQIWTLFAIFFCWFKKIIHAC